MIKARPKILIVDDEELLLEVIQTILEKEGFDVKSATNGQMAKSMVGLDDYVAVISDITMGGSEITGIDLLVHIRDKHPLIAVLLMSAYHKTLHSKDLFDLGASVLLNKPFSREELLEALNKACETLSGNDR